MVGAEDQIASLANHVIFGRRGSGKSSLLLYEMRRRAALGRSSAWIDMQSYSRRDDSSTIISVLREVISQATPEYLDKHRSSLFLERLKKLPNDVNEDAIAKLIPEAKELFASSSGKDFAIFLDDFHVLSPALQPKLLGFLYGFARGNRVSIKLSAVETFTRLWDAKSKSGLQVPHDAQSIRLDYNLTMADKATEHITGILDAHAQYCGLPSIRSLCTSADVLPRLVWVSAGVPRDALYLFSIAMTKASLRKQRFVTVQSINVAASEVLSEKLSQRNVDSGADADDETLERIKAFCIEQQKNNAFLIEIKSNSSDLAAIRKLADLRLLHVVSEGITRKEAGRKYMALILDYGFYVGIRAAKSVDLFNKDSAIAKYNELRALPVFS